MKPQIVNDEWSKRIHYMDNLRAIAMFLGVILHASVFYNSWPIPGINLHAETSETLHFIIESIHVFRMELFFLVSGFFASLYLSRKGLKNLFNNRIKRILLPLIVCVLLLQPWWSAITIDLVNNGNHSFWELYFSHLLDPLTVFRYERPVGQWFQHIWFLEVLFIFVTFQILINLLSLKFRRFSNLISVKITRLLSGNFGIYWMVGVTYVTLLLNPPWSDVPAVGVSISTLGFFGLFYFLGYFAFKTPKILESALSNLKFNWIPLFLGFGFLVTNTSFVFLAIPIETLAQDMAFFKGTEVDGKITWSFPLVQNPFNFAGWSFGDIKWHAFSLLKSYTAWFAVIAFIFLFKKFWNKENAVWKYLSQSSYWVYILHFPLQWSLYAYLFNHDEQSPIVGFVGILAVSTTVCLISYHFFVRGTFVGVFLNGRTYPISFREEWQIIRGYLRVRTLVPVLITALALFLIGYIEREPGIRTTQYASWSHEEKLNQVLATNPTSIVDAKRPDGRNSLHMASTTLHQKASMQPSFEKLERIIRLLVESGIDINAVDKTGQTALHYAAKTGNLAALEILCGLGANPNIRSNWIGETPLHIAAALGHPEMIKVLISNGADTRLKRKTGDTPEALHVRFHGNGFDQDLIASVDFR